MIYNKSDIPADLQKYFVRGEIGLEPTPDEYVAELVAVFRECKRILRADGTLWLNLGDSYTGGGGRTSQQGAIFADRTRGQEHVSRSARAVQSGLAAKQRLMIPARVALALQADGWWLRDEIIWHKPNPMPVSVTDRTTPAHEMLYMFSKSSRYFYDMEAVKEPIAESSKKRYAQNTEAQRGGAKQDAYELAGVTSGSRRPNEIVASLAKRARDTIDAATAHGRPHSLSKFEADNAAEPAVLRQPRSVWSVATRPFKGAHFATFPPDLIRPCIKAGCPQFACSACGAPHERVKEHVGGGRDWHSDKMLDAGIPGEVAGEGGNKRGRSSTPLNDVKKYATVGWQPTCNCGAPAIGGTVLDPFFGAGTTGLVAAELGRSCYGVELNPAYAAIAAERLSLKRLTPDGSIIGRVAA